MIDENAGQKEKDDICSYSKFFSSSIEHIKAKIVVSKKENSQLTTHFNISNLNLTYLYCTFNEITGIF